MRGRAVSLITGTAMTLVTSAALISTTGLAAASASTPPASTPHASASPASKEPSLAGYHFTVSKTTASLTVKADITVPTVSCSSGTFAMAPQVVVHYLIGTSVQTASAALALDCLSGLPAYGNPVLLVGTKTVNGSKPVSPGEKVAITITITKSAATVKAGYSTTVTDSGKGGRPTDVQYSVGLAAPPRYSPVKFSGCTTNGKSLASFKPGVWVGVNGSGKVVGTPSKISGGTSFSVTE